MSDPRRETSEGLYEKVLRAAQGQLPPSRPPRPSAVVVPWRERAGRLEVFWVERARALAFMGGWHAFPGGSVDKKDAALEARLTGRPAGAEVAGPGGEALGRRTASPCAAPPTDLDVAPGIVSAAIRELFEEVGLLPGGDAGSAGDELRRELLAGAIGFEAVFEALPGAFFAADRLTFAGRWVTPPLSPMRFDNRFFLLEVVHGDPRVIPGELAHGEWIEPARALERWAAGTVLTAPPILHILRVLAEQGPRSLQGLARLWDKTDAHLASFERIEFRPGFLLFPLRTPTLPPATHTNAFLVGFDDRAILIDPGSPFADEIERLEAALAEAAARLGRQPRALVLTHHHPDHVGGVAALAARHGLPVWTHERTAERLRPLGIATARTLADGEVLDLGGSPALRLRIHHTPGHASGHLVFHDETGGTILGGDLVSALSTIVIDPPEGSMVEYLASLDRIAALQATVLLPAHGPAVLDPPRQLRAARDHRLRREERVLAAWRAGARTPADIVPIAYDDAAPEVRPLAERQIAAHLERLQQLGLLAPDPLS